MRKGIMLFVVIALAMVVGGVIVLTTMYDPKSDRDATVPSEQEKFPSDSTLEIDSSKKEAVVSVLKLEGSVSAMQKDGGWKPVSVGQSLNVEDAVRTERKSKVVLGIGDNSTIELAEQAQVEVRELSDTVQRMGLIDGRASVDYKEGGERILQFENRDGTAVAEVRKGKFSVMNNGSVLAVATETGTVDLSGASGTVAVNEGMRSAVVDGAPLRPYAIPVKTLLKLVDPNCKKQRGKVAKINGSVSLGSRVTVNGETVAVNNKGRFTALVPLRSGKNNITIITEDILGRVDKRIVSCVAVDPGAPIKQIDIDWGAPKGKTSS